MKRIFNLIFLNCILIALTTSSCKKYLEVKPDQRLSTPETLADLQALMDNRYFYQYSVVAMQDGVDDFSYDPSILELFPIWMQQVHTWDPSADDENDWVTQYSLVLICNTVLDRVDDVPNSGSEKAKEIEGSALFKRAYSYYMLAQVYAPQYDASTAESDLGIVLRDDLDFNVPSKRSSVKQTYDRILADLQRAVQLLPNTTAVKTRPNKPAALGLLARVYLQMGEYEKAKVAADQSLSIYSNLIDYNDATEVDLAGYYPFLNHGLNHQEILYYYADGGSLAYYNYGLIDQDLYDSYSDDDLRKTVFFEPDPFGFGGYGFTGSYLADNGCFIGIATDEIYLIRAECNARLGNIETAVEDLETLLVRRYKSGTMPVLSPSTPEEAVTTVLEERRKELLERGIRWSDLRRLAKSGELTKTLSRSGFSQTLPPNDLRYTLLIPIRVMSLTELEQNPR